MNTISPNHAPARSQSRLISPLLQSTALTLSVAASAFALSSPALAIDDLELPTGGTVVGGSASLNYGVPGQLDINQASDRLVVDWNSFNIGEKATTTFVQPGVNALAVNRVTGAGEDPTQILGNLRANGRVVVLDRNGVIFGKNSRVDTAGIIASTGDVDTAQVMSGSDRIELSNMGDAAVENHGQITVAEGGLAALVAPSVRNSGTINARLGRVALASGDKVTVDLYGDQLIEMALDAQTSKAVIDQTGTISAEGGSIEITAAAAKDVVDSVINMDGVTTASSVTAEGGRIVLSADTINVASTARIEANAAPDHAAGEVKVVARDHGRYAGTIEAKGTAGTGFVETSAKTLEFVDGAAVATTGEWLIDPTNVTIDAVLEGIIETALGSSSAVTVLTSAAGPDAGNIYLNRTIDWSSTSSLTLQAHNDILLGTADSGLNATGAADIILHAARNVDISAGSGISTNGGDVTVNSQRFRLSAGSVNAHGGDITLNNSKGFEALANTLTTAGSGTVTLHQNKDADPFLSTNTIQNAINAVNNTGTGSTILLVGAGTYAENVTIDRSLILMGANAGLSVSGARLPETVIAPTTTGISIVGHQVTVDGVSVTGGTTGIDLSGSSNATVTNSIIAGSGSNGIAGTGATAATLTGNSIHNTGLSGIRLDNSAGANLAGNIISHTGWDGIRVDGGSAIDVLGNTISNVTRTGVYFAGINGIKVIGNTITSASTHYGVDGNTSTNSMVMGNLIDHVAKSGINLADMSGATMVNGNRIDYTGSYGISTDGTANLEIAGNLIGIVFGHIGSDGIFVQNSHNSGSGVTRIATNIISNTTSPAVNYGSGIQVRNSAIIDLYGNTISNTGWDGIRLQSNIGVTASNNVMTNVTRTGIYFTGSDGVTLTNNHILTANLSYGINGNTSKNTSLFGNLVTGVARAGINLYGLSGQTLVFGNIIDNSGEEGIITDAVANMQIIGNKIGTNSGNIGADGILVKNSNNSSANRSYIIGNVINDTASPGLNRGSGIQLLDSASVDIGSNTIINTSWDGIRVEGGADINVNNNAMALLARTGIFFGAVNGFTATANAMTNTGSYHGIEGTASSDIALTGNMIDRSGTHGIKLTSISGTAVLDDNQITNAPVNGIDVTDVADLTASNNVIYAVGGSGIYIHGPIYTNNVIYGNTVTGADVGMTFESGLIDLTGAANTVNNTRIGYLFAPIATTPVVTSASARFVSLLVSGGFSQVDLASNTIGSTVFNGQTSYYVELRNGALFEPGVPTLEDGLNATYDGLNPSSSGGFVTAAQLATLEAKFWHYNDDNTVGLFFFGTTPPLPISRVFRENIVGFAPGAGAAGFTITGLPRLPGAAAPAAALPDLTNPAALNALAPAAGPGATGELPANPTPEQVAALEPAAGPADAACWSDASNLVDSGRSASYSFASDPMAALSDAADCGNATP